MLALGAEDGRGELDVPRVAQAGDRRAVDALRQDLDVHEEPDRRLRPVQRRERGADLRDLDLVQARGRVAAAPSRGRP